MAWVLQPPGMQLSALVMSAAAAKGHIAMCQYLRAQRCAWDVCSISEAAFNGHVDLLRWLMDNGCPRVADRLNLQAAFGGSVQVLAYLQEQGLLATVAQLTDALDNAAAFNRLAAAKWLREQGAEWPRDSAYGMWRGDILAWAIGEGCTSLLVQ
jgi:hypothetical protein